MQSNKLVLIVAVAAGVLATVLAFTYISSATSALESREAEPTVEILFVVNDLPANHILDPDMDLRVDHVGTLTTPALARSAVKADEREALRGRPISAPIPAGVPLLYSHLTSIQDINLPPGSRAMTISVDAANLMGGILVPGDRVDIIISYRKQQTPAPVPEFDMENPDLALGALMGQLMTQSSAPADWEAEEVLSNIRIIAVGEHLSVSRQAQMFGMTGLGGPGRSSTVTLEVTPVQALDLIKATAGGSNPITLLLRPAGSSEEGRGTLREG